MSDGSSIEWCTSTWQPVVGCTRVSAGCDNCYAVNMVHRFRKTEGLTILRPQTASRPGLDWSGKVLLQPEQLAVPLRWKKPRRIFVCSQADLFHPAVPFEYVAAVFGVMAACPQHTFLVLTKRPERAREFFAHVFGLESCEETVAREGEHRGVIWDARGSDSWRYPPHTVADLSKRRPWAWPLPNVHLGVSVEDQETADERIPVLLQCPAALHWISLEPQIEHVDLRLDEVIAGTTGHAQAIRTRASTLRWVVQGGESGSRARPFLIEWARSVVEQCHAAGVPVFVKQLGSDPWLPLARPTAVRQELTLADRKGGDMAEWPADLRVREWAR